MKKILLSILALLIFHLVVKAQTPAPILNLIRTDSSNMHVCDTAHFRLLIYNVGITNNFHDTIQINYDNRATSLQINSTHASVLSINDSNSVATIITGSHSDTVVIDYSYYIPCDLIPSSSFLANIYMHDTIIDTRDYILGGTFISTIDTLFDVGYSNLYASGSLSTLSLSMGNKGTRSITLSSARIMSSGFDGYIRITDEITNACNLYEIDSIIIERVNPITSITTSIDRRGFIPSVEPSSLPFYYSPHIILSGFEHLIITEKIHLRPDTIGTDSVLRCIGNCLGLRINNNIIIEYGCDSGIYCNPIIRSGIINKLTANPSITDIYTNTLGGWDTMCFQNPVFSSLPSASQLITHRHVLKNTGSSTAFDVSFKLSPRIDYLYSIDETRTSEVVVPAWVSVIHSRLGVQSPRGISYYLNVGAGRPIAQLSTCINSFRAIDTSSETDSFSPIYSMNWLISNLEVGDSIIVSYSTYRCCPSDENRYVGNLYETEYFSTWNLYGNVSGGVGSQVANGDCGANVLLNTPNMRGIHSADLNVGSILGPLHLTGNNNSCDTTLTTDYQLPLLGFSSEASITRNEALLARSAGGIISGQLIVEVSTEYGLNPLPTFSKPLYMEGNFFSGGTRRYSVSSTFYGYDTAGGRLQVVFDLDSLHALDSSATYIQLLNYINNGYLHIPITPCCNGDDNPKMTIKIYLQTDTTSINTCVSCRIPIAIATKEIILHCPGCVTPGIIVNKCVVRRQTVGYPDINNNGRADIATPYTSIDDAVVLNRRADKCYIAGDAMSIDFTAVAQDGDNTDGGIDYATMRGYWQSVHDTDASHPIDFSTLYIQIENPCASANRNEWRLESDTLRWTRIGDSGILWMRPFLDTFGANYLYIIPKTALNDSFSMNDKYSVSMLMRACRNSTASECEIGAFMWWSTTDTQDYRAIDDIAFVPFSMEAYSDSSLSTRLEALNPYEIYLCETCGDVVNAFRIRRSYESVWDNGNNSSFISCTKRLENKYKNWLIDIYGNERNLFSYEYRPIPIDIKRDHIVIPNIGIAPGYMLMNRNSRSAFATNISTGTIAIGTSTAVWSLPTTTQIAIDDSSYSGTSNYILGDESNTININYVFEPTTCPDTNYVLKVNNNYADGENEYCAGTVYVDTTREGNSAHIRLNNPNPNLRLLETGTITDVYSVATNCRNVQLRNEVGTIANNTWMHIYKPSLGGHITSVSGGSIDTFYSDGDSGMIVELGTMAVNTYRNIIFCFDVGSCITPDSIIISYGSGCIDTLQCNIDTTILYLTKAQVSILHTTGAISLNMNQCTLDTLSFGYMLRNKGEVDQLVVELRLPVGVRVVGQDIWYTVLDSTMTHDTLAVESIVESIVGTERIRYYHFYDDTALQSNPYNSISIDMQFIIGSCIASNFNPFIYLHAVTYCDSTITDSIINTTVIVNASACPAIVLLADTIINATCNGSYDGSIRLVDTSGSAGLGVVTYVWSSSTGLLADTGLYIDSLLAGTYSVTATDGYGCSATASFVVGAGYVALPHPTIITPYTTCDSINTFVISDNFDTTKYQYWWEANNTVQQRDTIIDSSFVVMMNKPDSACNMIVYIRDKQTLCIDTMRIDIVPCCIRTEQMISNTKSSVFFAGYPKIGDTTIVTAENFRVNGVFTIDSSIRFQGCKFYMESRSKILIIDSQSLELFGVEIVACDTKMWQGIECLPYSIIYIKGLAISSRVYDADTAIVCRTNAQYKIEGTFFNRNLVCISIHPNTLSTNPSSIVASKLFCHTESPAYYGNTTPPINGNLFFPYGNEKTHFGVFVRNNLQLQLGDSMMGVDTRNKIEDMRDGIYSLNSGLQVKNCDFKNMRRNIETSGLTIAYKRGNAIEHENDSSILSYMAGLRVQHCNMDAIENACVYLNGKYVFDTIEYNTMNGYFGVMGQNLGNTTNKPNYSTSIIRGNIINYGSNTIRTGDGTSRGYRGIMLNACKKVHAMISNNIITSQIALSSTITTTESGIYLIGLGIDAQLNPRFNINDNKIYNGRYGINVANLTQPIDTMPSFPPGGPPTITFYTNSIQGNSIYSKDNKYDYRGIFLNNANNINIGNNFIEGRKTGSTLDDRSGDKKSGIYLNTAKNNRIFCNSMDYMYHSFYINGLCQMKNKLYGNNFENASYHIYGNASGGSPRIDTQQVADDGTALGRSSFHNNKMNQKARIKSVSTSTTSANVIWWERRFFPPILDPSSLTSTTTILPTGISYLDPSVLLYFYECPTSSGGSGSTSPLLADTGNATELYRTAQAVETINSEEEQGEKQMSEEYIYDKLKNEPELVEMNDSLRAYYIEKQTNYMGALDEIKEAMSKEEYALADEKLEALEPNEYQQEADKLVYTIESHLEQRAEFVCTEEELNTLISIANYCPIRYGASVYLARTLINTQKGYEAYGWVDEEICIEGVNYKRANPSTNEDEIYDNLIENPNIEIHPNPASQYVYYSIVDKVKDKCSSIKGYTLKDISGKSVLKIVDNNLGNSGKIDISTYPEGLYFIYFTCNDDTHVLYKFVINK